MDTKLNTTSTKYEKPEEFWQDLNSFRNQHREDCVSSKQINFDGSTSTFFDDSRAELGVGYDKKNEIILNGKRSPDTSLLPRIKLNPEIA